ncbi:sugar MFS transporter [Luteimonas gilva]|uniref:Sugar MFS transporter n=1 Tax=Luteimonas gilva TaxID=2572684 RepID=A0A4U5JYA3_9GAMM|nr:sugar MFS transporter [Luteimonas gilva]TKR33217.1 sugar MFS transporter [Luteimonas gilva]
MNPKASVDTRIALIAMTAIFFMWGFITELNDVLIPHLKSVFELKYWQAMLIQFCFFGAYLVMAVPAGLVVGRVGYKIGIVIGLLVAGGGALLILPAAQMGVYGLFLFALFVLASGIVVLQVSANPYVSLLGAPERAPSRLNFAQAINSVGHTIGPWVGGALILGATHLSTQQLEALPAAERAQTVQPLYLGVALALIVLAVAVYLFRLPAHAEATERTDAGGHRFADVLKHRHVRWGVLAIFLYVGAEVAIGSFIANYAMRPDIGAIAKEDVGKYVSAYWFLAMVGRFIGAALLLKANPRRLLGVYAAVNIGLLLLTMFSTGPLAMWSVIAIGLFNSIMFPTIFTLVIDRLGPLVPKASSLLVMAIFGGAVVPFLQGHLVDFIQANTGNETLGLQYAFVLPALCYAYIVWYGLRGSRLAPEAPKA